MPGIDSMISWVNNTQEMGKDEDKGEDKGEVCFWVIGDTHWFLLEFKSLDTKLGSSFV